MMPSLNASAANINRTIKVTSTLTSSITTSMPLARLIFSSPVKVANLPTLLTRPPLTTAWQRIAPDEVEAVVTGSIQPSTTYTVRVPSAMSCTTSCRFTTQLVRTAVSPDNFAWEQQLLAELNYLPATFTANTAQSDPASQTAGFYTWAFPHLPLSISSLWGVGNNNVIVRGALMDFQNNNNLPTTGAYSSSTWRALVRAVRNNDVNPSTYNYVTVSETSPEIVRLYVGGKSTFHTLANTGISVDPTPLGTFPVYLRYVSQTMSGTNPDGSHYSDPGIPWISYFVGGSALHGFIRATYGWPQSLGCVEMPFASAHTIWPHTPIGTLVTVQTS
jgi:peptidoglycan hydrolase-like protein with peptidoglycan-binding domain